MSYRLQQGLLLGLAMFAVPSAFAGEERSAGRAPSCLAAPDREFLDEVWAKVGRSSCLTCHKSGGDAEESSFLLRDPDRSPLADHAEILRHNRDAFARMARLNALACQLLIRVPSEDKIDFSKCRIALYPSRIALVSMGCPRCRKGHLQLHLIRYVFAPWPQSLIRITNR